MTTTPTRPPFHAPGYDRLEEEARAFDAKAAWHAHRAHCPICQNLEAPLCDTGDDLFFAFYLNRTKTENAWEDIPSPNALLAAHATRERGSKTTQLE
jgi:hypothetical protein